MSLREAAEIGNLKLVKEIVERGSTINDISQALYQACIGGNLLIAILLLRKGADVHAYRDVAFRGASSYGHVQVMELLLEHGADIHVYDDMALYNATRFNCVGETKLLLSRGATITPKIMANASERCIKILEKHILRKKYWQRWRKFMTNRWARRLLKVWFRPDMFGGITAKRGIFTAIF